MGSDVNKWLCKLLGHKLSKGPHPERVISCEPYMLFEDRCPRCGHKDRFWNTNKELGL